MAALCQLERGSNQHRSVIEGESRVVEDVESSTSISQVDAAAKAGVDRTTMSQATKVGRHGSPELVASLQTVIFCLLKPPIFFAVFAAAIKRGFVPVWSWVLNHGPRTSTGQILYWTTWCP